MIRVEPAEDEPDEGVGGQFEVRALQRVAGGERDAVRPQFHGERAIRLARADRDGPRRTSRFAGEARHHGESVHDQCGLVGGDRGTVVECHRDIP